MTKLKEFANQSGLELVATSSVWDIYNTDHLRNLCIKKGTNLYKTFLDMYKNGHEGGFTLVIGRIGRNGHSKTEVGIFKGTYDGYAHDEIFINHATDKAWADRC